MNSLQKRAEKRLPPSAAGKSLLENPSLLEEKGSSLSNSRPKKRIFNEKEKEEEYKPRFTNNLVESIIDDNHSKQKEKLSTNVVDPLLQTENQSSIDFGFSQDQINPIKEEPPKLEYSKPEKSGALKS